jgi:hypothetical protein
MEKESSFGKGEVRPTPPRERSDAEKRRLGQAAGKTAIKGATKDKK